MDGDSYKISVDLDEKKLSSSLSKLINNAFSSAFQKNAKRMPKASKTKFSPSNSRTPSTTLKATPESLRARKIQSMREKVEKYRLSETKKLMKTGMTFEQARKKAFTKSLMSARDLRDEEYKQLSANKVLDKKKGKQDKKNQSAFSKTLQDIAKNTKLGRLTMASFLGNSMSKMAGGIIGFLKASTARNKELGQSKAFNSAVYGADYENLINTKTGIFKNYNDSSSGNYIGKDKRAEILAQGSVLKGTLRDLGQEHKLPHYLKEIVRFVSAGYDTGIAVDMIDSALRGDASSLIRESSKFSGKYGTEEAQRFSAFAPAMSSNDKVGEIDKILKEINTSSITSSLSESPEIKSAKAMESLSNTLDGVVSELAKTGAPLIDKLAGIVDRLKGGESLFSVIADELVDSFVKGLSTFWNDTVVGSISGWWNRTMPNWMGGGKPDVTIKVETEERRDDGGTV